MNLVGEQYEKQKNSELVALLVPVKRVRAATTVCSRRTVRPKTPESRAGIELLAVRRVWPNA